MSYLFWTMVFRLLWQWYPSLWTCLLFWGVAAYIEYRIIRRDADAKTPVNWPSKALSLAGASMNALVTIANGGRMPFIGGIKPYSLWVLGDGRRLLFLCDRFPAFGKHPWAILSVGDFFIVAGFVCLFLFRRKESHVDSPA